jgi:hypothetical protein
VEKIAMDEVYVSTDVETDGPIPGPHSMLSLGSAAFVLRPKTKGVMDGLFTHERLGTFSVNLETLEGARMDPVTKREFWDKQPEAWAACRKDPVEPGAAMEKYWIWVKHLPGNPVFVGYPAGFDFLFTYRYLRRFGLTSPFSFSALDVKTYAMATMRKSYRESTKKNMPKEWFPEARHTHVAVDDAIEQGELFMNMLIDNLTTPRISGWKGAQLGHGIGNG